MTVLLEVSLSSKFRYVCDSIHSPAVILSVFSCRDIIRQTSPAVEVTYKGRITMRGKWGETTIITELPQVGSQNCVDKNKIYDSEHQNDRDVPLCFRNLNFLRDP